MNNLPSENFNNMNNLTYDISYNNFIENKIFSNTYSFNNNQQLNLIQNLKQNNFDSQINLQNFGTQKNLFPLNNTNSNFLSNPQNIQFTQNYPHIQSNPFTQNENLFINKNPPTTSEFLNNFIITNSQNYINSTEFNSLINKNPSSQKNPFEMNILQNNIDNSMPFFYSTDQNFIFGEIPNYNQNNFTIKNLFPEILLKFEEFIFEFITSLDSDDNEELSISILDLDKNSYFDFNLGFFNLPEEINDEMFTNLNLSDNIHRITKIINIISILYSKMSQNCKTTKRELYYNDVELYKGTQSIDLILQDICSIFNLNRFDLFIFPAQKGLFSGIFKIYDSNNNLLALNSETNFSKINLISSNFYNEFLIETDAKYILIVEKESIYNNLISNQYFKEIFKNFIIVTGKGYSDYLTKFFIKRISLLKPEIKIFYFGDLDAFGLEIYLNYLFGSKNSSRENNMLCLNNIFWLGLNYDIVDFYLSIENLNDNKGLIQINSDDLKKIDSMLDKKEYFDIKGIFYLIF